MSIRDLALQVLESALRPLIDLDEDAGRNLAKLHGNVVAVQLSGTGLTLYFVPGHDGHLQVLGRIEGEPDATISGSPLDLLRASDPEHGRAQLFAGHVTITGNTDVAHRFSQALGSLSIDWEEHLSHWIGDVGAHEVGNWTRKARDEARRIGGIQQQNLAEYLTEEARLVPHRFEFEAWQDEVERTRDDVDRLAARLDLLTKSSR